MENNRHFPSSVSAPVSSNQPVHMIKEEGYRTISLSELEELQDAALGLKVLVKCLQTTYYGVLNHILNETHRTCLWLEKVSIPKSGKNVIGIKKLCYPEIISVSIVGVDLDVQKRLLKELNADRKNLQSLLMQRILTAEEADEIDENSVDETPVLSEGDTVTNFAELLEKIDSTLQRYKNILRPTQMKIIDTFGVDLNRALDNIQRENLICICGRGMKLGRGGLLAWISIATSNTIYLIDIAKMTPDRFFNGRMRGILNSVNVTKVTDDARKLQDYLFIRHQIDMHNVFDIQASHIYLYMQQHKNQVPYLVKDLSAILHEYFRFPSELLTQMLPRIEDESQWLERPLANAFENVLIFSVAFLRELHQFMTDLMLVDLQQLTNLFVTSISCKSAVAAQQTDESIVPVEIQELGKPEIHEPRITYSAGKVHRR